MSRSPDAFDLYVTRIGLDEATTASLRQVVVDLLRDVDELTQYEDADEPN